MGELIYFTMSINGITHSDIERIIDMVVELRGTHNGMSVSYDEVI